jgi:peptidoglycan/xylan/chitin deacetylase (PgdA/CDA1 family)
MDKPKDEAFVFEIPENHPINPTGDSEKTVALCFDDGPYKGTDLTLKILESYGVKATFFVMGTHIKYYEESFYKIIEDGNEIANHTYTHTPMLEETEEEAFSDIQKCEDEIKKYAPNQNIKFFRAPQWSTTGTLNRKIEQKFGYTISKEDRDCEDWGESCTVESVYANAVKHEQDQNGNPTKRMVLVLHCDGPEFGSKQFLIKILNKYLEDGYKFVTMSEYYGLE